MLVCSVGTLHFYANRYTLPCRSERGVDGFRPYRSYATRLEDTDGCRRPRFRSDLGGGDPMLSGLRVRFRSLFRRTAVIQQIDQELQFHLEQQMEKYLRTGLTREQASRRVRLEFGGLSQIKEDCREASGVSFLEHVGQDVRYAIADVRSHPGFHRSCRNDVGAWHWGEHCRVQPDQCGSAKNAAGQGSATTCAIQQDRPGVWPQRLFFLSRGPAIPA